MPPSPIARVPISQLPNATVPLTGAELVPLDQGGVTSKVAASAFSSPTLPENIQEANYQFVLSDAGKYVYHKTASTPTYTIPLNATTLFPLGTPITIATGAAAGNITVAIAGGGTLRQAGTTNTGNRTIASNAMVTLLQVETDNWLINGVGLS